MGPAKIMDDVAVSIHICAGNVSSAEPGVADFYWISIHTCVGMFPFSASVAGRLSPFQLIHVRGMFRITADTTQEFADVSTHICAGNVSGWYIHRPAPCRGFDSYICGGCFRPQAMPRLPLELFQFIYVRGMFLRWFCGGFNSYMCGECFLPHQV